MLEGSLLLEPFLTEEGAGPDGGGPAAANGAGWRLEVHDNGMRLGNGAFGAVFLGTASFAGRDVRVAVNKLVRRPGTGTVTLLRASQRFDCNLPTAFLSGDTLPCAAVSGVLAPWRVAPAATTPPFR